MTTITKERLLTIKQWRETYGPGSNVVLPAEEAEELARIALASLEAEPVASCIIEDGCMCVDGFGEYVGHSLPDGTHQLYAAPPVPDKLPREYRNGWPLAYSDYAEGWNSCRAVMLQSGNFREIAETSTNSPVIPSEVLSAILKFARVRADFDDFDGDRRGIGDCLDETEHELIVTINKYASQLAVVLVGLDERAAFNAWNNEENLPIAGVSAKNAAWLAWQARAELGRSLAVNSPVTPDGWISCSERMPDSKTAVLVAKEFDRKGDWRMKWATYIPGHPDANDGWIIPGASWKPSHWMPLPEPPQEAK